MNMYTEYVGGANREAEQNDDTNLTSHQYIKRLQHENNSLRVHINQLNSMVRDISLQVADLKSQVVQQGAEQKKSEKYNMRATAQAMVAHREDVNRAIYCERNKRPCGRVEGIDICGCGGDNVTKNTIQQREDMCTQFELMNRDWVSQRNKRELDMYRKYDA